MIRIISDIICSFLILTHVSFAQKTKMQELNDQVLCNVYAYDKADSATKSFLKENLPYLTQKRPEGQIVMAPIGIDAKHSIISMKFLKHPFFDFNISEGMLNFETVESRGEPKYATNVELYLSFKTEQSADSAFNKLMDLYKLVSVKQDISIAGIEKTGKFIGDPVNNFFPKAIIILSKDNSGTYKIDFRRWFKSN